MQRGNKRHAANLYVLEVYESLAVVSHGLLHLNIVILPAVRCFGREVTHCSQPFFESQITEVKGDFNMPEFIPMSRPQSFRLVFLASYRLFLLPAQVPDVFAKKDFCSFEADLLIGAQQASSDLLFNSPIAVSCCSLDFLVMGRIWVDGLGGEQAKIVDLLAELES